MQSPRSMQRIGNGVAALLVSHWLLQACMKQPGAESSPGLPSGDHDESWEFSIDSNGLAAILGDDAIAKCSEKLVEQGGAAERCSWSPTSGIVLFYEGAHRPARLLVVREHL